VRLTQGSCGTGTGVRVRVRNGEQEQEQDFVFRVRFSSPQRQRERERKRASIFYLEDNVTKRETVIYTEQKGYISSLHSVRSKPVMDFDMMTSGTAPHGNQTRDGTARPRCGAVPKPPSRTIASSIPEADPEDGESAAARRSRGAGRDHEMAVRRDPGLGAPTFSAPCP